MRPVSVDLVDPIVAVQTAYFDATGGQYLSPCIAKRLVETVHRCADTIVGVAEHAPRLLWENNDHFQDHLRLHLRLQLLHDVVHAHLIPAALPTETLRYFQGHGGIAEIPVDAIEAGADWASIEIRLSVPARVGVRTHLSGSG